MIGHTSTPQRAPAQDTTLLRQGPTLLQGMQGRFSGRLETKNDEKLLVEECKLVGPLLGGAGKRGEKTRQTLAKIVRGIAAGDIRRHCEAREATIRVQQHCRPCLCPSV